MSNSRATVQTIIDTLINDNTNNEITALDVRTVLSEINNSTYNKIDESAISDMFVEKSGGNMDDDADLIFNSSLDGRLLLNDQYIVLDNDSNAVQLGLNALSFSDTVNNKTQQILIPQTLSFNSNYSLKDIEGDYNIVHSVNNGTIPNMFGNAGKLMSNDGTNFTWINTPSTINGTGFVKANGTTISYDNNTYLTTSSALNSYVTKSGTSTMNYNAKLDFFNDSYAIKIKNPFTNGTIELGNYDTILFRDKEINTENTLEIKYDRIQFFKNLFGSVNLIPNFAGSGVRNIYLPSASGVIATTNDIYSITNDKADLVGGLVPSSQLPSYVDDVIEGYLSAGVFYNEVGLTTVITGVTGKIYVDLTSGQSSKQYRYTGSAYIQITNGLIASTADVPEGSNLYFLTSRVLNALLTGLSVATGTVIVATDSVLIGIGKLQKQITDGFTGSNIRSLLGISTLSGSNTGDNAVNTLYSGLATSKENTITPGTTSQYYRGDKSFVSLATEVLSTLLTGLSVATGTAVVATDSVLIGVGKLQRQISDLITSVNAKFNTSGGTFTGLITLVASTSSLASLKWTGGADKTTSLANGDEWYVSTGNRKRLYKGSQSVDYLFDKDNTSLAGSGLALAALDATGNISRTTISDVIVDKATMVAGTVTITNGSILSTSVCTSIAISSVGTYTAGSMPRWTITAGQIIIFTGVGTDTFEFGYTIVI